MAADVTPALLEQIRKVFAENQQRQTEIEAALQRIQNGGGYEDAQKYAEALGKALSDAFGSELTDDSLPEGTMWYNIADRVLRPMLLDAGGKTANAAVQAQNNLNAAAGIGMKAQPPTEEIAELADGIVQVVSGKSYQEIAGTLPASVENFSLKTVDATLKKSVTTQGKVGLRPKVVRIAAKGSCEWCNNQAGVYQYPNVPKDAWKRHKNCHCSLKYDAGDGKKVDTVWTEGDKAQLREQEKAKEERKTKAEKDLKLRENRATIRGRVNKGEYSLTYKHQEYLKHIEGTKQFLDYKSRRNSKNKAVQSILTISENDAQEIINKYCGKGTPSKTKNGVGNVEYVSTNKIVGKYINKNGEWENTHRVAIHYGKNGTHIVPVSEEYYDQRLEVSSGN